MPIDMLADRQRLPQREAAPIEAHGVGAVGDDRPPLKVADDQLQSPGIDMHRDRRRAEAVAQWLHRERSAAARPPAPPSSHSRRSPAPRLTRTRRIESVSAVTTTLAGPLLTSTPLGSGVVWAKAGAARASAKAKNKRRIMPATLAYAAGFAMG